MDWAQADVIRHKLVAFVSGRCYICVSHRSVTSLIFGAHTEFSRLLFFVEVIK